MNSNAFVLDWTMDDYELLKQELGGAGFNFKPESGKEHMRITIPFARVQDAAAILQPHLNTPGNYVDAQFPDEKCTVIIFRDKVFTVRTKAENDKVVGWAIARGLLPEQADWPLSF